jgi:hypothetical protein
MVRPENLVTPKNHVGKCHRLLFNFEASCQLHGGIAATQLNCLALQHAAGRVYYSICGWTSASLDLNHHYRNGTHADPVST